MPKLIILVGIPFSGYKKYAEKVKNQYEVLSRDHIRDEMYGKNCLITSYTEDGVEEKFNFKLRKAYALRLNVLLCNTNCKEEYIDQIRAECPSTYDIEVKFFKRPLILSYLNNFLLSLKGERYIPFRIMRLLNNNFKKINKEKYKTPINDENINKLYLSDYSFFLL